MQSGWTPLKKTRLCEKPKFYEIDCEIDEIDEEILRDKYLK